MIIDGGVRSTEHDLSHKLVSQKVVRKAQFDFRGFVQLGDLFIESVAIQGTSGCPESVQRGARRQSG